MDVYMDVHDMIGNTPVLKLNNLGVKKGVNLYAKLELMNPAGSVKDRVGIYDKGCGGKGSAEARRNNS